MYDTISEYDAERMFEDMLDECYEEIEICGLNYAPSVALKRVDPVAYRCAMLDYMDACELEIE